jgi:hypothetical protein
MDLIIFFTLNSLLIRPYLLSERNIPVIADCRKNIPEKNSLSEQKCNWAEIKRDLIAASEGVDFGPVAKSMLLRLPLFAPDLSNSNGNILAKHIPSEVKYALAEIKTKTLVPIIIPVVLTGYDIPLIACGGVGKKYAVNGYSIDYGFTDCKYSGKPKFVTGGELISEETLDPIKQYDYLFSIKVSTGRVTQSKDKTVGGYITLSRGIRGFYIPPFCPLCSVKLVWTQGEYQYFIQIPRGGSLKDLVKIANSAIDNQP